MLYVPLPCQHLASYLSTWNPDGGGCHDRSPFSIPNFLLWTKIERLRLRVMAVTVLIEGDCVEAEEVAAGVLTISRL